MAQRMGHAVRPAVAVAVILLGSACGGGGHSTAPRKLTSDESTFVTQVRAAQPQDPDQKAARTDTRLADDGAATCTLLRAGEPDQAYAGLTSGGYSPQDGATVEQVAVQTLCPDTRPAYETWLRTPPKS